MSADKLSYVASNLCVTDSLMSDRRIVELNTINGVKNACMSFPVQNVWKAGIPLAVHGVVYNPADGKLKVRMRLTCNSCLSPIDNHNGSRGSFATACIPGASEPLRSQCGP